MVWLPAGVLIDVSEAVTASNERNYAIPVEELEAWQNLHGVIPDGAVVLIRTGWGARSHDLADYSGLDAEKRNNFPGGWEMFVILNNIFCHRRFSKCKLGRN